ncbi:MAG: deoxyribose-phosphate aldolase [Eubacteriales bacterium]|nr:deoxyribose-phosphate aldolase [Eubacteriales bacterium]
MNVYEVARMIDISAVRTHHNIDDIKEVVEIAKKYKFINVHALPCWVKDLAELLKDEPDIYVGAPAGFPGGAHRTEVKRLEAKYLVEDGAQEIDIVMNIGKLKNKEYDYVLDELKEIINSMPKEILKKVIIEINCLTDEEVKKACELVIESGADFVKTGTGWVPAKLDLERIRMIRKLTKGKIKVKVAGGIRTREEFDAMVEMGIERFGINTKSALEIVRSFEE